MRAMGTRNRERRRTKQAKRRQEQRSRGGWNQGTAKRRSPWRALADEGAVEYTILAASHANCDNPSRRDDRDDLVDLLVEGLGFERGREVVTRRLSSMMRSDIAAALGSGWKPQEITRVLRRQAGAAAAAIATEPLADVVRHRHRSNGQDAAGPHLVDPTMGGRSLDHTASSWSMDLSAAICAFAILEHLPALPDLGSISSTRPKVGSKDEERMLTRIRALLSKAEASAYPEEADAFMAKAQQLMTRHCIDRALMEEDVDASDDPQVEARRVWLDDPYLQAKALLLAKVASANRCRAVVSSNLGFSTVIGHSADLEATELLFTSLLVQATRRITALGSDPTHGSRSRRPSYRRSFFVAYAGRIGARLHDANESATTAADEALGNRLLPVLARREDHVDAAVESLFGELGELGFSLTDFAGWAAGTAAADMADLAVQETLPHMAAS